MSLACNDKRREERTVVIAAGVPDVNITSGSGLSWEETISGLVTGIPVVGQDGAKEEVVLFSELEDGIQPLQSGGSIVYHGGSVWVDKLEPSAVLRDLVNICEGVRQRSNPGQTFPPLNAQKRT